VRARAVHDGGGRSLRVRDSALAIAGTGASPEVALDAGGNTRPPRAAGFSPDGRTIYLLRDRELGMWDTATGAPRGPRYIMPAAGLAAALAISPDGRMVALARSPEMVFDATSRRSRSDRVTLLGADDLQVLADGLESIPEAGSIGLVDQHVWFTPDSALLVLSGGAGLTVWDLGDMRRLDEPVRLPAHSATLGFGTHPRVLLLISSASRALLEVDLDPRRWAAEACRAAGRQLTTAEWERHVGRAAEYRPACGSPAH
jgi:hypothetical protein